MKRLIWLPLAGFLLVAGAAVAAAAPTVVERATGLLAAAASPSASTDPTTIEEHYGFGGDLLETVLADLVGNGTITQTQSDAVTTALRTAIDDKRAEMDARRTLFEGFIADGVITQDEINQLPADDPMRTAFDSIANDGQITLDQLRDLGPGFGHGGPGHHGRGPGPWAPDSETDTTTDSGTDTSTDS